MMAAAARLFIVVTAVLTGLANRLLAGPPHKGLAALPPLLEFADGTPVKTMADWTKRRDEIQNLLTQYYYG